jgi:hypothetical protein
MIAMTPPPYLREPAGLHDIYGSALAAQPGKS